MKLITPVLLLLFLIDIHAQDFDLEVLEYSWVKKVQNGAYTDILENPTNVTTPYVFFKIKGGEDFLEVLEAHKSLPLRIKWVVKSGIIFKRNQTDVPDSSFDFSKATDILKLNEQIDVNGAFVLHIWSECFKSIDEGTITASLVFENNAVVKKCSNADCRLEINIE